MDRTLYIAIIVAAVLLGGAGFYFLTKKFGMSLVNVSLAIVTAVKNALENTSIKSSKVMVVLDLVVQALTYVQAICGGENKTEEYKIETAISYIENIGQQFNITLTDGEIEIIKSVLKLGFAVMTAVGVNSKVNYKKLYAKMAKYAGISEDHTKVGMNNLNAANMRA
jgi:hypothetical protein